MIKNIWIKGIGLKLEDNSKYIYKSGEVAKLIVPILFDGEGNEFCLRGERRIFLALSEMIQNHFSNRKLSEYRE